MKKFLCKLKLATTTILYSNKNNYKYNKFIYFLLFLGGFCTIINKLLISNYNYGWLILFVPYIKIISLCSIINFILIYILNLNSLTKTYNILLQNYNFITKFLSILLIFSRLIGLLILFNFILSLMISNNKISLLFLDLIFIIFTLSIFTLIYINNLNKKLYTSIINKTINISYLSLSIFILNFLLKPLSITFNLFLNNFIIYNDSSDNTQLIEKELQKNNSTFLNSKNNLESTNLSSNNNSNSNLLTLESILKKEINLQEVIFYHLNANKNNDSFDSYLLNLEKENNNNNNNLDIDKNLIPALELEFRLQTYTTDQLFSLTNKAKMALINLQLKSINLDSFELEESQNKIKDITDLFYNKNSFEKDLIIFTDGLLYNENSIFFYYSLKKSLLDGNIIDHIQVYLSEYKDPYNESGINLDTLKKILIFLDKNSNSLKNIEFTDELKALILKDIKLLQNKLNF